VPVEFGTINLAPSDPLLQSPFGLFGAMVIEPQGATWREDSNSAASANVYASQSDSAAGNVMFREFVAVLQNNMVNVKDPVTRAALSAVNYKSSAMGPRLPAADTSIVTSSSKFTLVDVSQILLDTLTQPGSVSSQVTASTRGVASTRTTTVGTASSTPAMPTVTSGSTVLRIQPPQTPSFVAIAGTPVRMRVLRPYGSGSDAVFELHGHVWQEEPYINNSTAIGTSPTSQNQGSRGQLITLNSYEVVIPSAGGVKKVPGDYLYRTYGGNEFAGGLWGRMRVTSPQAPDAVTVVSADPVKARIDGANLINPRTGAFANNVTVMIKKDNKITAIANVLVNPDNGRWTLSADSLKEPNRRELLRQALEKKATIIVKSSNGAQDEVTTRELEDILQSTNEVERGKKLLRVTAPAPAGGRQHLEPGEKPTLSGAPGGN
jgi:hypothetical protein